jgi:hypothetical protein
MDWPDPKAGWESPANSSEERERWQGAINAAIQVGSLILTDVKESNALVLEGSCPRCNHPLRQRIRYGVVRGLVVKANIDCGCRDQHDGRGEDVSGCGWGGPLTIELHPWGA